MSQDVKCRQIQLTRLHNYLKDVDTEVTMILQNLQWDRKHLREKKKMDICQYNKGHRVPPDKLLEHESGCFLKSQGYSEIDSLLPSPINPDASTLIKLSGDNIAEIIKNASYCQPSFNIVLVLLVPLAVTKSGCSGHQPLTLERLQATYTVDERRAIYDAVVSQVPSCHNLSDLALLSSKDNDGKESKAKSKLEILAELRDMRRRRTKYRVAAKTRNYSDVLRDVITTQMELYAQAHNSTTPIITEASDANSNNSKAKNPSDEKNTARDYSFTTNRNDHSIVGETSTAKDTQNVSRYSRQHEEYETRKRRHNKDNNYNSLSVSSKSDHHRDHYESKLNRRDDGHYPSNSHRKSHRRHDRYENRDKYREGNSRTAHRSLNTTTDKYKDNRYVDSKFEGKYSSKEYHSSRVGRQKRYEHTHKNTVKIKKEKEGYHDDHSNSGVNGTDKCSEDHETHSSRKKIKVEDIYLTKERTTRDDCDNDNRSKSSDTFNKNPQSTIYDKHIIISSKDKHRYYEKNDDIQQQDLIQNIKQEKDILYEKPLGTNDKRHESRVADDSRYKNKNERFRSRDDEYRKDKRKEKVKTYKRH